MLRVTKEVIRIFPTIDLEGNEYKYLNEIKDHQRLWVETKTVLYEFQANASIGLIIKKSI